MQELINLVSDSEPDAASSDSDIQFAGYHRNVTKSVAHCTALQNDGLAYAGYKAPPQPKIQRPPFKLKKRDIIIVLDSDEDIDERPLKKQKHDSPESQEENDYAAMVAALDLNCDANWNATIGARREHIDVNGQGKSAAQLALHAAATIVKNKSSEREFRRIAHRPQNYFDLDLDTPYHAEWENKPSHIYLKLGRRATSIIKADTGHTLRVPAYLPSSQLIAHMTLHYAGGAVQAIAQSNTIIAVASTTINGDLHDEPSPYNKEGPLFASFRLKGTVLEEHIIEEEIPNGIETDTSNARLRKHHLTVRDIALDPTCSTTFASAGRDNRVLLWEHDPMEDDESNNEDPHPWKLITEVRCKDSPEGIKYKPGTSLLAIQCNDGYVYLVEPGGADRYFPVAPPQKNHITADIAWGSGPSDCLLFASSACREGDSGFHKAYDIVKNKVVMAFDADKQACSSLALDSLGERLYIATEGTRCKSSHFLRQYDVRSIGSRRATQQVQLEPFASSPDRKYANITSVSLSHDGIYIAVGCTDNWANVYDARMLQRGPLHHYAHEGGDVHNNRAANMTEAVAPHHFGVVKTQWVDSSPFGYGLVSGGGDGCVRLWDPKLASTDPVNGRILAQSDDQVSTFSLGDVFRGEIPLIVGDTFGRVISFDFSKGGSQ